MRYYNFAIYMGCYDVHSWFYCKLSRQEVYMNSIVEKHFGLLGSIPKWYRDIFMIVFSIVFHEWSNNICTGIIIIN